MAKITDIKITNWEENLSYYINRTFCEVLEEMRTCFKTHNYSPMLGLIEECQIFASRMESALGDKRDIRSLNEERSQLRKEVKELEAKVKELETKIGDNNDNETDE